MWPGHLHPGAAGLEGPLQTPSEVFGADGPGGELAAAGAVSQSLVCPEAEGQRLAAAWRGPSSLDASVSGAKGSCWSGFGQDG